jgi:lactate dehydrogenase-like 2-hydroxyacid dehydrogenase
MRKIVFLDLLTMGDVPNLDQLRQFGELVTYQTTAPEQLAERIQEAEIVITNKVVVGKEGMDTANRLKLICVAATGTNNVDKAYAETKGIAVKNVVDYSTHSVAQLTFTLLLALLNQSAYYDEYVKSGSYALSPIFTHLDRPFWQLQGKQLGIIGLGNIGKQVARIAEAFGMRVVYYSSSGRHNDDTYRRLELDELLATSDVVSIHAPLTDKTAGLIDYEKMGQMKKTALLLNTSRGGIIKEADLVRALDENLIAGAGLDVFEKEPMAAESPLLRVRYPERLILTPHIAWASMEARTLLVDRVCENIKTFLEEDKVKGSVA